MTLRAGGRLGWQALHQHGDLLHWKAGTEANAELAESRWSRALVRTGATDAYRTEHLRLKAFGDHSVRRRLLMNLAVE